MPALHPLSDKRFAVDLLCMPRVERAEFGPDYWAMLRKLSHSDMAVATETKNLRDTATSWTERIAMIDGAKRDIIFSYYAIGADDRGFALLDRLIAAAKRGVRIIGSLSWMPTQLSARVLGQSKADVAKFKQQMAALEAAGGRVAWQATPQHFLRRFMAGNHHKALIVDGQSALVGGRNIYHLHFAEDWNWQDMEMRLDGPIASIIGAETLRVISHSRLMGGGLFGWGQGKRSRREAYRALLEVVANQNEKARRESATMLRMPDDPEIQCVLWDPTYDGGKRDYNRITRAMSETIKRAKTEVILTGNSFNPTDELAEAVLDASRRGVKVRVVTCAEKGFKSLSPLPYINASQRYQTFVDAGVMIYEAKVREHGKMLVVDGKLAAFGSYNPELASDRTMVEAMYFSDDAEVVNPVLSAARSALDNSVLVTPERANALATKKRWPFFQWLAARILRRHI